MSGEEYEEARTVTRIGTMVERFTPECEVVSLVLALSDDGESEILSLQRELSQDDEGPCLVLSPSQQCSYRPFHELTLSRTSLGMTLTTEAQSVFNASSVLFRFDVADDIFQEIKEKLEVICSGGSYFTCTESAI